MVIKVKSSNGGLKMKVLATGSLFENEILIYEDSIPAINQLFVQSGIEVELGPERVLKLNFRSQLPARRLT